MENHFNRSLVIFKKNTFQILPVNQIISCTVNEAGTKFQLLNGTAVLADEHISSFECKLKEWEFTSPKQGILLNKSLKKSLKIMPDKLKKY